MVPRRLGKKSSGDYNDIGYGHTISTLAVANHIKENFSVLCTKENYDLIPNKFNKIISDSINYESTITEYQNQMIKDLAILEVLKPKVVFSNEDPSILQACNIAGIPCVLFLEELFDIDPCINMSSMADKIVIPHPREFIQYAIENLGNRFNFLGIIKNITQKGMFPGIIIPFNGGLLNNPKKEDLFVLASGRRDQELLLEHIIENIDEEKSLGVIGKKLNMNWINCKSYGFLEDYRKKLNPLSIMISISGYNVYEILFLGIRQIFLPRLESKGGAREKELLCEWLERNHAGIYLRNINDVDKKINFLLKNEKALKEIKDLRKNLNFDGAKNIAKLLESYKKQKH